MIFNPHDRFRNFISAVRHLWIRRSNFIDEMPRDPIQLMILVRLILTPITHSSELSDEYEYFVYAGSDRRITDDNRVPQLKCWLIDGCTVLENGVIISKYNKFLMINLRGRWIEMSSLIRKDIKGIQQLFSFLINPVRHYYSHPSETLDSISICYTGHYCQVYYHWILEQLPALRSVIKLNKDGIKPNLILHSNLPEFAQQSISLIGNIGFANKMSFKGKIHNTNVMMIPEIRPFGGNDYTGTRSEIRFLRKQLCSKPLGLDRCQKSIFCSREDAKSRRVENRDELMETLDTYGFELYSPGKKHLENQIETFGDADLVIGPHGSNLTGIIFADNLTLIEIIGKKPRNNLYEYLCNIMGHRHIYLRSKENGDDFQVSISEVENLLSNFPELSQ